MSSTSATVYLVAPNNVPVTSVFRERGLLKSRAEDPSSLLINGYTSRVSGVADKLYSNVTDHIAAQLAQAALTTKEDFRNIFKDALVYKYANAPVGHFHFRTVSDEQKDELSAMGLEYDTSIKMYRGIPNAAHFKQILKHGAKNGKQVPGGANCDGFFAYITLLKAMNMFSIVSQSANGGVLYVRGDKNTPNTANIGNTGKIKTNKCKGALSEELDVAPVMANPMLYRVDDEDAFFNPTCVRAQFDHSIDPYSPPAISEDGLLFPYFKGMMLPDRDFVPSIFQRYFLRGLASNAKSAQNIWAAIRGGYRNLHSLPCGMMFSHAFYGMQLADFTKSSIRFLLGRGAYHGFVLEGSDFSIINLGVTIKAQPGASVNAALPKILGVDASIIKILAIISLVKLHDGSPRYKFKVADFKDSRTALNLLRQVDVEYFDRAQIKEIDDELDSLTYGEVYAQPTPKNIASFLEYVSVGDLNLLSSYPTILTAGIWKTSSRIAIGLGIFGLTAPTISFGVKPKASVIQIPPLDKEDTVSVANGIYPTMPIKMYAYAGAVATWSAVLSHGEILLPMSRPGKKEKHDLRGTVQNFNSKSFTDLWTLVRRVTDEHRSANAGKRKRGLEDDGPSVRKRPVLSDPTAMDMDEI